MPFKTLWRTTTFRLTVLYGVIFAVGTVALLGMVYAQSVGYLTRRVDGILNTEADGLVHSPVPGLRERLIEDLTLNGSTTNIFALFSADGRYLAGNLDSLPAGLQAGGSPVEVAPRRDFPANARLIERRLPSGELLVVGRDVNQLREMRAIIGSALGWSGITIILAGLTLALLLSVRPLRRLRTLQLAGAAIAAGDLTRRMPTSDRLDELDMFASTVNRMMDQVEILMSEVKGATDVIAHDLLTPLTRARTRLSRMPQSTQPGYEELDLAIDEIDDVLERFRAILRMSQLDSRDRRAGFSLIDLNDVLASVADLYEPVAEAAGIELLTTRAEVEPVLADPKLLVEAVSNLVDNAIKFSPSGGKVHIEIGGGEAATPRIIVADDGPGIGLAERTAVLQRFRRAERNSIVPGFGIGLSVVAAIARLHGFELSLQDAAPGLRAVIDCRRHKPG